MLSVVRMKIQNSNQHGYKRVGAGVVGKNVRNSLSYEEWNKLDWDKAYPNADIRISARVVIKDFGKFK